MFAYAAPKALWTCSDGFDQFEALNAAAIFGADKGATRLFCLRT